MLMLVLLSASIISMTLPLQGSGDPWEVPAKFKNMKNPTNVDAETLKLGKMIYSKNCASCHGKIGKGDGTKARGLDTFPGDFTAEAFNVQTDGEKFYKSKFGRGDMPKFENKIADEDIWNMVSFMNTFKE